MRRLTSKPGWPSTSRRHAFNPEQHWLEMIRDHIAANLGIEIDDSRIRPSTPKAAWARCINSLAELPKVIEELNRELAA